MLIEHTPDPSLRLVRELPRLKPGLRFLYDSLTRFTRTPGTTIFFSPSAERHQVCFSPQIFAVDEDWERNCRVGAKILYPYAHHVKNCRPYSPLRFWHKRPAKLAFCARTRETLGGLRPSNPQPEAYVDAHRGENFCTPTPPPQAKMVGS